ncbi:MAG: CofH family radical SAM protein, partial [bacterium]|nr:CofH family radical SAM protein [bacterium]
MSSFSGNLNNGPMDPEKYQELVAKKESQKKEKENLIIDVEPYRVPAVSSGFAKELLKEALTRRLTGGELVVLFEEASLHDLGRTAHLLRLEKSDPEKVSFIIDRNITYTNLCYADCGFCAFNRHQDDNDGYLLEISEILEKCRSVVEAGGNQILLQGGHHPKKRLAYYEEMLLGIKKEWPQIWIHGFSPSEIQHFSRINSMSVHQVLSKLKASGLDSVPGGGAEILSDRVRRILAPGKAMAGEWIEIMETAHAVGLPSTVTMMFAHVETYHERVEHFLRARESQDKTGGYTAFIPWTFQPSNTPLMQNSALKKQIEAHGYLGSADYLRTLAISRIALDNF